MAIGDGTYRIDGGLVNNREDIKHRFVPGPLSSRRVEGFVGDVTRYVIKSRVLPESLIVFAWLEATSFAALHTEFETYNLMMEDLSLHTVRLHNDSTFSNMDLAEFRVIGDVSVFKREAGDVVAALCYFDWQRLVPASL